MKRLLLIITLLISGCQHTDDLKKPESSYLKLKNEIKNNLRKKTSEYNTIFSGKKVIILDKRYENQNYQAQITNLNYLVREIIYELRSDIIWIDLEKFPEHYLDFESEDNDSIVDKMIIYTIEKDEYVTIKIRIRGKNKGHSTSCKISKNLITDEKLKKDRFDNAIYGSRTYPLKLKDVSKLGEYFFKQLMNNNVRTGSKITFEDIMYERKVIDSINKILKSKFQQATETSISYDFSYNVNHLESKISSIQGVLKNKSTNEILKTQTFYYHKQFNVYSDFFALLNNYKSVDYSKNDQGIILFDQHANYHIYLFDCSKNKPKLIVYNHPGRTMNRQMLFPNSILRNKIWLMVQLEKEYWKDSDINSNSDFSYLNLYRQLKKLNNNVALIHR